ncbi:MAG TPA: CvpA family protein [Candidatus Limnocylindria bacterium]|nr:CvpA family protein [Candidatus Limnocylindria bacterium]
MEIIGQLNWIDLLVILLLAAAVFFGYTQGIIRYVLSAIVVVVAFILASQLKAPITDSLGFWTPTTPELKELWIFIFLFFAFVVGGWFVVRAFYRQTRLPIVRQVDEVGGAVLGVLFATLVIGFHLVVLDTFFQFAGGDEVANSGWLRGYYGALNESLLVGWFRDALIPTAGLFARPFVPPEVATLLRSGS